MPREGKGEGRRGDKGKGGGVRGGRHGGKNDDRETIVSKKLSYILRHGAKGLGLHMDEKGFVGVEELLRHQQFASLKVTLAELQSIVASNAKQRFELVTLPECADLVSPSSYLIRATQGHSIKLDSSSLLTPILSTDADCPAQVVHGTYPAAWSKILASGGLKTMGRTHIHFAADLPGKGGVASVPDSQISTINQADEGGSTSVEVTAQVIPESKPTPDAASVISGMRASANLLVWVDVKRSMEKGIKWWRSTNGVVLTEGDEQGSLRLEFVDRVVQRDDGSITWKRSD